VTKGEIVCELDSSQFREQAKQQEITVTQAESALAQAREALEIQRTQNESDIAAANLQWQLALLDLEKFKEGEYPQQQKQLSGNVALAEEERLRAKETYEFTKDQVKKGYKSQNDLEAARIKVKEMELKLQGAEEELKVLQEFTKKRTEAELEANAREFELELKRVELKAKAALTQFEKDLEAQKLTYEVEKERYDRLLKQVEACTIRATQDGEVVYANLSSSRRSSEPESIEEGATVRERQAIINLPDVTKMKVDCRIHESLIGAIQKGLRAKIRVDAYPDETFEGQVAVVSSVPMTGRWPNTDLREYQTEIHLTDPVEKVRKLRPGLTAQVEILVDRRRDVLQVPIQAIVTVAGQRFAYVYNGTAAERRSVKVGQSNQSHIEVLDGLEESEFVVLNPRSRFDAEIAELEQLLGTDDDDEGEEDEILPLGAPGADASSPENATPGGQQRPRGGPGGGERPGRQGPNRGQQETEQASAGSEQQTSEEQSEPKQSEPKQSGEAVNAVALFKQLDLNQDGQLTKDELPERMRERFEDMDADNSGGISLEEFQASPPQVQAGDAAES
jgi:HlyD family secretion protein